MDYDRSGSDLTIRLTRDFNLLAARHIERLAEGAELVTIDCSKSRLADTEAIIMMHRLKRDGVTVQLVNPPEIFSEVLSILDLNGEFDVIREEGSVDVDA